MTAAALSEAITAITGLPPGAPPPNYRVTGPEPALQAYPQDDEQVAALLHLAAGEGQAVVPRGAGTKDRLGAPLRRADLVLSTTRLTRLIEYNPADLTVTAQAGMTLARLQALLGREGQRLALDPPHSGGATLGGVVAANHNGPRRLLYGGVRDIVLGMRVALTAGHVIKCGGRVVKNVAGYDMNKLVIGSMGSLGVITEVTVKVRPLPDASKTYALGFPTLDQAGAAARRALQSELLPAALELLSSAAAAALALPGPYTLVAALEETPAAVAYQIDRLGAIGREFGATADLTLDGTAEASFWDDLRDYGIIATAAASLRANVPAVNVPALVTRAEAAVAESAPELAAHVLAGTGTGTVWVHLAPPAEATASADLPSVFAVAAVITAVAGEAEARGGSLVVEACHPAVKAQVDVWGSPGAGLPLMQGMKQRFDPAGILNPGRYVGGL